MDAEIDLRTIATDSARLSMGSTPSRASVVLRAPPCAARLALMLSIILSACTSPLRSFPVDGGTKPTGPGGQTAAIGSSAMGGGVTGNGGTTGVTSTAGAAGTANIASAGGTANIAGTTGFGGTLDAGGAVGSAGTFVGGATVNGGTIGSAGRAATGGKTGTGGVQTCPSIPEMISDFESTPGKATTDVIGGRWYAFSNLTGRPRDIHSGTLPTESAPDATTCNRFALHVTSSNIEDEAGLGLLFGTGYWPDASAYTGISFRMKSGSGTPPAVFFEVLTKESVPATEGGTATSTAIDVYNTRGQLLNAPWASSDISTSYQTFTVPFGTMVPRWVPSSNYALREARGSCTDVLDQPKCQAKPFLAKDVLGLGFSIYRNDGFPQPSGSNEGAYDLWIDDVVFVKNDKGLQTREGFPLSNPGSFGSCMRPRGPSADAKFLVPAYNLWKATFVRDNKVIRPDYEDDTLSEGIAFGMLIALNMNDQPLFDGLYATWKANPASGASSLMKSCLGTPQASSVQICKPSDGSATGADQDAAFALLMAGKLWGGTYRASAIAMLKDIWDKDIDGSGTKLPKGGSKYQAPTGTNGVQITSASYFAPSYYRAFATVDPDATHDWTGAIGAVYKVLGGPISGKNGLIPGWCANSCTVVASTGNELDSCFYYQSHRIPMRLALDYCFYGTTEAKTYTDLTTNYFINAAKKGIGLVMDLNPSDACRVQQPAAISASQLGTAAVGAMASGKDQTFLDDVYQAVFDLVTRGTLAWPLYTTPSPVDDPEPTYGYYNGTVGMLALLILTGNFIH
jgi:endoglucanase